MFSHLTTLIKNNLIQLKGSHIFIMIVIFKKIIKRKMNNEIMQISHQNLKVGTLLKISNPKNNEKYCT